MSQNFATPWKIVPPSHLLEKNPRLKTLASQLSLKYVHHQGVSEEDLKIVGSALWEGLGVEGEFQKACELASPQILPLVISTEEPSLLTLPWECLYHSEHGFLGKSLKFTLSRQLSLREKKEIPPLSKGPLKVLLFTSLPDEVDAEKGRLDTESEQAGFLESFDPWLKEGKVKLVTPDDGRFSHFRDLVRGKDNFHLVYLSGHGFFKEDQTGENPSDEKTTVRRFSPLYPEFSERLGSTTFVSTLPSPGWKF